MIRAKTPGATAGLNYNYFRDYEPATGRYVESDPLGLQGGISTYGYVTSRPLNSIDPSGLVEWKGEGVSLSVILGGGAFLDHYYLSGLNGVRVGFRRRAE